jgi:dipeptidyl aminopeptidase/acylaminoacyl peptidase
VSSPRIAAYGTWGSPISAEYLSRSGIGLGAARLDEDDVYWLEMRPSEGGRYVIVRSSPGEAPIDVTPPGFNARTRVHEYGGGSYFLHAGTVFFSNYSDQRLYRQDRGGQPIAITPKPSSHAGARFADGQVSPDGRLIVAVRETHGDGEAVNDIVVIPADGSAEPSPVVTGNDFYSSPRLSPDGRRIAWVTWNHPNMPWDTTELWVADFDDGRSSNERRVAGGQDESVLEPVWSSDGILHFVSDRTEWWNVYRATDDEIEPVCPMDVEFGGPQWQFGHTSYDFATGHGIVCCYVSGGRDHLGVLHSDAHEPRALGSPFTSFSLSVNGVAGNRVVVSAAGPRDSGCIALFDLDSGAFEVLRRSHEREVDPHYISEAEEISFPTGDGLQAHALYYGPWNPGFAGPDGELPPLIVDIHGGPTGRTDSALSYGIQFWTTRGFGVVDVNYGGSTGYGREYRERLRGQWGVVDVADTVNAALYLAKEKRVDSTRMAIRGASAGGYTTFCALAFYDVFTAGVSYFGVADLETFVDETHKFESRYMDSLVGPYPGMKDVYRKRSPVHFVADFSCPIILFQGLEDKIVPPSQAQQMVDALERARIAHAYMTFEGEQHGFRKAETIQRVAEAELFFYGKVFGFNPAGDVEPFEIKNL